MGSEGVGAGDPHQGPSPSERDEVYVRARNHVSRSTLPPCGSVCLGLAGSPLACPCPARRFVRGGIDARPRSARTTPRSTRMSLPRRAPLATAAVPGHCAKLARLALLQATTTPQQRPTMGSRLGLSSARAARLFYVFHARSTPPTHLERSTRVHIAPVPFPFSPVPLFRAMLGRTLLVTNRQRLGRGPAAMNADDEEVSSGGLRFENKCAE